MSQKVINLQLSQVSHGRFLITDQTVEEVVVGYRPSMIRLLPLDNGNPKNAMLWYATDPAKVLVLKDTDAGTGYAAANAPFVVNERGFDVTISGLDSATEVVWEVFGSQEGAPCEPEDGGVYNLPAEDGDGESVVETFTVSGIVKGTATGTDESDGVGAGVIVSLVKSGDVYSGATGADSKYAIDVPAGAYTLMVSRASYQDYTASVTVTNDDVTKDVQLVDLA